MMLKLHDWSHEIWSKSVFSICKNYAPHLLFHVQIVFFCNSFISSPLQSFNQLNNISRFVMVVRKNVLEHIIALVVAKNKVRLKKCLSKFQIWQSSIVQLNLYITSLCKNYAPHLLFHVQIVFFCNSFISSPLQSFNQLNNISQTDQLWLHRLLWHW
jgi:hypothetical protein